MATGISAVVALLSFVCTVTSMLHARSASNTNVAIKLELAQFKIELRDWINGSFMRAREVEARFCAFDSRLKNLE
jgi:hypothetical protein